jgi:hypothetical protein
VAARVAGQAAPQQKWPEREPAVRGRGPYVPARVNVAKRPALLQSCSIGSESGWHSERIGRRRRRAESCVLSKSSPPWTWRATRWSRSRLLSTGLGLLEFNRPPPLLCGGDQ